MDQLAVGDLFELHILGNTLQYQVDQILVVLPEEVDALQITPGKDFCTLVTCTPYGVNTHRLLVRGERVQVQNHVQAESVQEDAHLIQWTIPFPLTFLSACLLPAVLLWRKRKP